MELKWQVLDGFSLFFFKLFWMRRDGCWFGFLALYCWNGRVANLVMVACIFCHQETVIKLIDEKLTEMWIKGRESLPPTVPVQ
jgi:hypothetical protein